MVSKALADVSTFSIANTHEMCSVNITNKKTFTGNSPEACSMKVKDK